MNVRPWVFPFAGALLAATAATAQDPAPPAPDPTPPPAAPAPAATSPVNPTFFNPAIAVIGNFLASAGHNPVQPSPAFQVEESEVSFQAVVDPYARADLFLSFNDDGVEVEEGYVTFLNLPWQTQAKAGKFKVQFGKINTLHLHVLPWVDEPLPLPTSSSSPRSTRGRPKGSRSRRSSSCRATRSRRPTSRSSTARRERTSSSRPPRAT